MIRHFWCAFALLTLAGSLLSAAKPTLDAALHDLTAELAAAAPTTGGKPLRVAVCLPTCAAGTEAPRLAAYVQEVVTMALLGSRGLQPVNRSIVNRMLDGRRLDMADESARVHFGRDADASCVVLGTYWDLGDSIKCTLVLHDVESADALAAASAVVPRADIPPALLGASSSPPPSRSSPPTPSSTAPIPDRAGLTYVFIPPGTYERGAPPDDREAHDNERPSHRVTLRRGFWLGRTEVTQEQWQRVMGSNPSEFKGRHRPVENMAYPEAVEFCRRLSALEGVVCRLPTEAEWEWACRAGTTTPRYGPVDEVAWTRATSPKATRDVARRKPNGFGLFDTLGNVFEWTLDRYAPYGKLAVIDPRSPADAGHQCVARGGCWAWDPSWSRASARYRRGPQHTKSFVGLRVLREP